MECTKCKKEKIMLFAGGICGDCRKAVKAQPLKNAERNEYMKEYQRNQRKDPAFLDQQKRRMRKRRAKAKKDRANEKKEETCARIDRNLKKLRAI